MPIPVTAWRNFIDGNTVLLNGEPWPWQYDSDDMVPMDLTDVLDADETINDPGATLRKLPAFGESDFTDATTSVRGIAPVGNVVLVHHAALDQGSILQARCAHRPTRQSPRRQHDYPGKRVSARIFGKLCVSAVIAAYAFALLFDAMMD
jgi:hypothetical protein